MRRLKRKRHFWSADTLIVLLAAVCVGLSAYVGFTRPVFLIPLGIFVLMVLLFLFLGLRRLRKGLRRLMNGHSDAKAGCNALAELATPAAVVGNDKTIVWHNEAFAKEFAGGNSCCLLPINKMVPGLDQKTSAEPAGQNMEVNKRRYTVYGSTALADEGLFLFIMVENTALKERAAEYLATRPAVLYIVIDTYDEVLKEMRESERAQIISKVDKLLEQYIGRNAGLLRRVSNSRYLAIVEERYIKEMVAGRFDVLDDARKLDEDASTVSLSIGVGRQGATFKDCEEMAVQALDMSLGRGGDQAAVRVPDGSFEFYGGVSRSIEKRTKVKSRIIASAIKDLIAQCDSVLIMGHKDSDMDCVGAAVGMLRFCRICHKPAAIVINRQRTLAQSQLKTIVGAGYETSLLSPEEALAVAGKKTLLIVVDTHMKNLLESLEVYAACGNVVVIDHHRKMVGHIDNAVVFYHEPYASSASELVTELLQYVGENREDKLTQVEAEALLAGIMLDTRTFSLHVGVRTFEAAAYLRRMGAQTANVKKLFSSSMDSYLYRNHLVSEAHLEMGCAVVVSDKVPPSFEVVAPQAANDLLTIEGVQASFVAIQSGDQIRISARSMGEINVQLIMEKLHGGGHLTMAGAQLKGVSCDEARKMILKAISEYHKEHKKK